MAHKGEKSHPREQTNAVFEVDARNTLDWGMTLGAGRKGYGETQKRVQGDAKYGLAVKISVNGPIGGLA